MRTACCWLKTKNRLKSIKMIKRLEVWSTRYKNNIIGILGWQISNMPDGLKAVIEGRDKMTDFCGSL